MKFLFIIYFTLSSYLAVFATEPFLIKLSFNEGLPSQTIYDLFQDKKGYLYLGTEKGLIRYNGVEFKKYSTKNALSNSLNNVTEDVNGNIWCKNFSNQILVLKNDTLVVIPELQKTIIQYGDVKEFIIINNTIWVASQNAIYSYDTKSKTTTVVLKNNIKSKEDSFFDIIYHSKTNSIFASDMDWIYEINENKIKKKNPVQNGQKNLCLYKDTVYYNLKTLNNGIYKLNSRFPINTSLSSSGLYYNYLKSTDNKLWGCSNKGLVLLQPSNEFFILLPEKRISDIIIDKEGNKWISTLDNGLYFLPNYKVKHKTFEDNETNTPKNYLRIIKGPNNTLFAGNNLGTILQLDTSCNVIKKYTSKGTNAIECLYYDSITSIVYHTLGYHNLNSNSKNFNVTFGKCVYPDDEDNFLLSTYNSSLLFSKDLKSNLKFNNKNNYEIVPYSKENINALRLKNTRSRCNFYSKKYQKYYFGSANGLIIFDKNGNESELKFNDKNPIVVFDIKEDKEGYIWLATLQYGVIKLDDIKIIAVISALKGLLSNHCKRLFIHNNLAWVVSDDGLNTIDVKNYKVNNVSSLFSLRGIDINDIVVFNNKTYLATNTGIIYFPINLINTNQAPTIIVDDVLVNGKSNNLKQTLNFSDNNIELLFDAIHFKSQGDFYYRYKLNGYDSNWVVETIKNKGIKFLSLPAGDYNLNLQAFYTNNYSPIIQIPFSIQKPFWLTWWFVTCVSLLLIYVLLIVYRLAARKTKKQELIKEQLALSQLIALRAQMNPHFLFNVLNAVQGLIFANKKSDAADYLGKFADLMRKTLEMSDKQFISLDKEIEILKTYIELESARFDNDFNYEINISKTIAVHEISIPSMVIQPFVENAIKHGLRHLQKEKKLVISIEYLTQKNDSLILIIDDNGIGFEASLLLNKQKNKHISFATNAIESRINLLNKILQKPVTISINHKTENLLATGTKVEIIIPINHEL